MQFLLIKVDGQILEGFTIYDGWEARVGGESPIVITIVTYAWVIRHCP